MMTNHRHLVGSIAAVLLLLISASWIGSAADENGTWIRTYEGADYGAFFDITAADNGNVLVVGTSYHAMTTTTLGDVLVAELSPEGDVVWKKTYGGDAHDQGLYIQRMADAGYLILGETESMGAGKRDLYLLHVDKDGDLLWQRTIGGEGTEWAKGMIALADGGFLLVGETDSFGADVDAYVIRLDAAGDTAWSTTLDSGDNESGTAALEAPNGDLLVLATVSYGTGASGQYRDSRLYRLDSEGNMLWTSLYSGDDKQAGDAMAWASDGDIVIAGLSGKLTYTAELLDFWMARVDAETGEMQWNLSEGSQYADDYGIAISSEHDGSFLVVGLGPGFPLLEVTDAGKVMWLRTVASDLAIYSGFAVLDLDDGSFLIPGFKYVNQVGDAFDAILLHLSP